MVLYISFKSLKTFMIVWACGLNFPNQYSISNSVLSALSLSSLHFAIKLGNVINLSPGSSIRKCYIDSLEFDWVCCHQWEPISASPTTLICDNETSFRNWTIIMSICIQSIISYELFFPRRLTNGNYSCNYVINPLKSQLLDVFRAATRLRNLINPTNCHAFH